jgi:hypothetical protein
MLPVLNNLLLYQLLNKVDFFMPGRLIGEFALPFLVLSVLCSQVVQH